MNGLQYYLFKFKALRGLSRVSNNIYRLLPTRLLFYPFKKKTINALDKDQVKIRLLNMLGCFSDYHKGCSDKEGVLNQAENTLKHQFDILGSGPHVLDPIDWHIDFKSGYRWSKGKFYKDYRLVDLSNNADIKLPWELSNSHHFLWLGQAYLLTKDEKYTREYITQLNYWIKDNPLMRSVNWTCAMLVAMRATCWIYSLNMFIESELVTSKFVRKVMASIYQHAWFIFNNLEKGFPGSHNHYMANIVGLLFVGKLFGDTKAGKRWFNFALKEFYFEVRYQILPSGPSYERSTSYHRLMTELVFYSYLFLKRININLPLDIRHRVYKMLDFILHYTKPDGYAPLIGDDDSARLLPFVRYKNTDHRYLLSLAAIEFNEYPFKKYSNGYVSDAFFMFGLDGKNAHNLIPYNDVNISSKNMLDAGFCIIRDEDFYLFINNSGATKYPDHSQTGGSHTHADLLSFELSVGKTTFLVDPGTYAYSASKDERNRFRSTQMHNTLVVDGKSQHTLPENNIFKIEEVAYPIEYEFSECESVVFFKGSHDGYKNLRDPIIHQRLFLLRKKDNSLLITDNVLGRGTHLLQWYFHFNTDIDIRALSNNIVEATNLASGQALLLEFNAPFNTKLEIIDSFLSPSYGIKKANKTVEISAKTKCPAKLITDIRLIQ